MSHPPPPTAATTPDCFFDSEHDLSGQNRCLSSLTDQPLRKSLKSRRQKTQRSAAPHPDPPPSLYSCHPGPCISLCGNFQLYFNLRSEASTSVIPNSILGEEQLRTGRNIKPTV